jgi:hypothetical protein
MFKSHITLSLGLLVSSILSGQTILYVDKDAPNTDGDGLSWATAFKHLNDALDYVESPEFYNDPTLYDSEGATICVAEGKYYPDEGANAVNDDQNSIFNFSFRISKVIGGFQGNETSVNQADPATNKTVLSGLIFEEYGITDLGTDNLMYNSTTLVGFNLINKSSSAGSVSIGLGNPVLQECVIENSVSSNILISGATLSNCSVINCESGVSLGVNIQCRDNTLFMNNSATKLISSGTLIDSMFIENQVSDDLFDSVYSVTNCVIYRNVAGNHIFEVNSNEDLKIKGLTYVDNYNVTTDPEIEAGALYLEKSLFFRSGFNRSQIIEGYIVTLGYNASGSGNHLPISSKFFGLNKWYNGGSTSGNNSVINIIDPYRPQATHSADNIAELFLEGVFYSGNLPTSFNLSDFGGSSSSFYSLFSNSNYFGDAGFSGGPYLGGYSFTPELMQTLYPNVVIPDPFIDSDNPLGADGIPFTSDDGLNLDPASAWADEVINTPTINYDYGSTDILGNDRIIGGKIDLGAYEYTPASDADGDGVSDADDAFYNDPAEYADTDGDLIGDNADDDDDGDGIPDATEIAAGLDPKQYNGSLYNFVQSLGQGTFTEMELQEARQAAINGVLSDPTSYDLYTPSSIMDLNFGGVMIQASESGNLDFSYTIESSDDLTTWETHSQPTIEITPSGSKHFMRIRIGEP